MCTENFTRSYNVCIEYHSLCIEYHSYVGGPLFVTSIYGNRIYLYLCNQCIFKPVHVVSSIKQSPVFKGHICLVLSYELNHF